MILISNLYNASKYKNIIINLLLKDNDFVTLMSPQKPPHNQLGIQDMLLGGTWFIDNKKYEVQGQLFDHNFVTDIIETDIDMIRQNIFTDFNLYICIFTAKTLIRITDGTTPSINEVEEMGYEVGHYGNRIDVLCDIVDGILNGNKKIKGISV